MRSMPNMRASLKGRAMENDKFLGFLDCAKGFYKQGLDLIEPDNDEFAIISGCLLLVTGLEKLLKHALEVASPLLTLENVKVEDAIELHKGATFSRKQVVSLGKAFDRLTEIYPVLKQDRTHISIIVDERNFLVHQTGYFTLGKLESRVRFNLANITESVCQHCLSKPPEDVFGSDLWERLAAYRDVYRMNLQDRINLYKRLYAAGEDLQCDRVELSTSPDDTEEHPCPICAAAAILEQDVEVDSDNEPYPYPSAFQCANCGFSLSDANEIEEVVGRKAVHDFLYGSWDDLEEYLKC